MKLIEILENRKEAPKVAEVAKMLGGTPKHIYKMAKAGLIPCFHVKGAIRFCPSEVARRFTAAAAGFAAAMSRWLRGWPEYPKSLRDCER